jgi:excisionase family DNA binding protein
VSDAIVPLDHHLLTAEEVAELVRLPVSTIYDLARTGRLPHLKIDGPCDSAGAISRCIWPSAAAPRSRLGSESAG